MLLNKAYILRGLAVLGCILLSACQKESYDDLIDFVSESKKRPPGEVKPLKQYPPYRPYSYSAHQLRAPFTPPSAIETVILTATSDVKPDFDRIKQRLENFEFGALSMVGSVEKAGVKWALIRDPEGAVERVKEGYYLGKNNGRIVKVDSLSVDVIEIVPNGNNGWLERPNIISME